MSYLDDLSLNKAARQAKTSQIWGFKCYCPSCAGPYSSELSRKQLDIAMYEEKLATEAAGKHPKVVMAWIVKGAALRSSLRLFRGLANL